MPEPDAAELPITGYLGRFSCRPGGALPAHVSVRDGGRYRARLQRVICGDPNPRGPGLRFEDLSHRFDLTLTGRRQAIHSGSYGVVERGPHREPGRPCTWTILVCAARLEEVRTVLAEEAEGVSIVLAVGPDGARARLAWTGGAVELATKAPLRRRRWHRLWLTADPARGAVALGQVALDGGAPAQAHATAPGLTLPGTATILFAAEGRDAPRHHFTGKLEAPALLDAFTPDWPRPLAMPASGVLARWDFSIGIGGTGLVDTGPSACHGRLVNLPTRGVVGAFWSGRETCWRHAPDDYAAIAFHDDDLDDCRWESDFAFSVPDDLPSGAYALHLQCEDPQCEDPQCEDPQCEAGEDRLPFYVLPARQGPHAPVAFLASTFTYQAYANHARGNLDDAFRARMRAWGAAPNPDDHPVYGRSTYNRHGDGSGIAFSSRLRPILTMRPGFLTFDDARGSGLRHYPADTHLLAWLDAKGFAFDVITDEDLDDEGVALLAPYKAVLTGSHPEYHTPGTLDALEAYTGRGGRLAYLGGNGFYWRIARHPEMPGVIEIRRAEGGIRAWEAEPGEYHNAFDGQLGGLWRRNRRPPQRLVGIGFSGQGLFEGTHYRRLEASYKPEYAWVFEGITQETLGDYGLSGGGAAGFELDRADVDLGTPEGAVILARSDDPPTSFVTVPEEMLTHVSTVSGETPDELIRGEIVYFQTPSGGAVFSVGSITFCGSLWNDGFTGPISTLLENVVRGFAS